MRFVALALMLSLAACSVTKNTDRNSGVGFGSYDSQ
jgi:hypothetical protein